MERLFAPWRLEFITGKRQEGCVFCAAPADREKRRENLVLHVGPRAFVIMNRFPYTSGHLLIVPNRHTSDLTSLTAEENLEVAELIQVSLQVLTDAYRPEGFNLGMNLGLAGGAGIRDHVHWHIVPRWFGDTNFLPVFADVRSIPEMLLQSYDRLLPGFEERGGKPLPPAAAQPEGAPAECGPAGTAGDETRAAKKAKGGGKERKA